MGLFIFFRVDTLTMTLQLLVNFGRRESEQLKAQRTGEIMRNSESAGFQWAGTIVGAVLQLQGKIAWGSPLPYTADVVYFFSSTWFVIPCSV